MIMRVCVMVTNIMCLLQSALFQGISQLVAMVFIFIVHSSTNKPIHMTKCSTDSSHNSQQHQQLHVWVPTKLLPSLYQVFFMQNYVPESFFFNQKLHQAIFIRLCPLQLCTRRDEKQSTEVFLSSLEEGLLVSVHSENYPPTQDPAQLSVACSTDIFRLVGGMLQSRYHFMLPN